MRPFGPAPSARGSYCRSSRSCSRRRASRSPRVTTRTMKGPRVGDPSWSQGAHRAWGSRQSGPGRPAWGFRAAGSPDHEGGQDSASGTWGSGSGRAGCSGGARDTLAEQLEGRPPVHLRLSILFRLTQSDHSALPRPSCRPTANSKAPPAIAPSTPRGPSTPSSPLRAAPATATPTRSRNRSSTTPPAAKPPGRQPPPLSRAGAGHGRGCHRPLPTVCQP